MEFQLLQSLQVVQSYLADIAENDKKDEKTKITLSCISALLDIELQSATDTMKYHVSRG